MAANSLPRRLLKRILYPVINERSYAYLQAASKAWDIHSGKWSEPELELIPYAVRGGETALDIGANYGIYSYYLSRVIGAGRVYAFEPIPFTYQTLCLVGKMLRCKNVEFIAKGCSEQSGAVTFRVPFQSSGAFAAGQAYIGNRNDDHEGKESQVRWQGTREVVAEIIALDEFLPPLSNLSLIKCDIEGAELYAFRGAEKLISHHLPTIICEINPWFLEGFNLRLSDLTDFFLAKGYQLFHYRRDMGAAMLREVRLEDIVEDNYVFIHPARLSRFASLLKPLGIEGKEMDSSLVNSKQLSGQPLIDL